MSERISECLIFAGPTRHGLPSSSLEESPGITWLPPARRGDVEALVRTRPAGTLAIVDGYFHHSLAVGHREIREAVERGWTVWGLSSIGAIRAYEMRDVGVRGFGRVYETFLREHDFRDDEVALLHEPSPPYRAATEPLVHLRVGVAALEAEGAISAEAATRVLEILAARWFGERTLDWTCELLRETAPELSAERLEAWWKEFERYRVKRIDLQAFVESGVWRR
jgi:hypothetical protein